MTKLVKILLIILLSILVIGTTIFFVNVLKNNSFSFITRESTNIVFKEEYDDVFTDIAINSKFGNIIVNQIDEKKVTVEIYGEKDKVKVDAEYNTLFIETDMDGCTFFCFNRTISKVIINLPKDYAYNLAINDNYGNITVGQFDNMILKASLNAGDINVKSVKRIKVDNNFGDIDIGRVNEYMMVDESFGNITIGEVTLNDNSSVENSFGNITIGRTNEIKINAKTSLGKAKIHNNNEDSYIILNIKNSFGNIIVNN